MKLVSPTTSTVPLVPLDAPPFRSLPPKIVAQDPEAQQTAPPLPQLSSLACGGAVVRSMYVDCKRQPRNPSPPTLLYNVMMLSHPAHMHDLHDLQQWRLCQPERKPLAIQSSW